MMTARTLRLSLSLAALSAGVACGGEQASGPGPRGGPLACADGATCPDGAGQEEPVSGPEWMDGTAPADLPPETFTIGVGTGEDAELARVAAEEALALALLGPLEERPEVELPPLFAPDTDQLREDTLSNGHAAVLLAVSRAPFVERLRAWLAQPPKTENHDASQPTGMLAATLSFLRIQQRAAFGCQRLTVWVPEEACDPVDTTMARRQVAGVARELKLEPVMRGGIPHRQGGLPYVAARVRAEWTNAAGEAVPWPQLPIRFAAAEGVLEKTEAVTDEQGQAEVVLVQLPPEGEGITATVDRERLLSRSAELWPVVSTSLNLRPVTLASGRIAVHVAETVGGEPGEAASAATALAQGLVDRGFSGAKVLTPEQAATLAGAKGPDLVAALRAIAETSRGEVDQVVVGEAASDFASRMSGRWVSHEATGRLRVYDAWTGKEIGKIERATQARGIGDANAGRAALQSLGGQAAEALVDLLQNEANNS